jgi:hypothetical protein
MPTQEFSGSVNIRVQDSAAPPQVTERFFIWRVIGKLKITTISFPPIASGIFFRGFCFAAGGLRSFRWNVSAGALPPGMLLDAVSSEISGIPTNEGTYAFTLKVSDSGIDTLAQTAERRLTLMVRPAGGLGRNDTIATATPLSNGFYRASISPLVDPPGASSPNPDVDVFKLTANPGAIVSVEALVGGFSPPSPLDPVIEFLDANGTRLKLCSYYFWNSSGPFNQACMNDDFAPGSLDAKLLLRVPADTGGPLTFYVRVLDARGSARPDMLYNVQISGVN